MEQCVASIPDAVDVWIRCNNEETPVCRYEKCDEGEDFVCFALFFKLQLSFKNIFST